VTALIGVLAQEASSASDKENLYPHAAELLVEGGGHGLNKPLERGWTRITTDGPG